MVHSPAAKVRRDEIFCQTVGGDIIQMSKSFAEIVIAMRVDGT